MHGCAKLHDMRLADFSDCPCAKHMLSQSFETPITTFRMYANDDQKPFAVVKIENASLSSLIGESV
jgi:hypothetical protein